MPGPIVVETVMTRMYVPLAVAGLARTSVSISARALSRELARRRTRPCRCGRGRCPPSRRGTRPCRPWLAHGLGDVERSPCRPWGSASGRADRARGRAGRPGPSCRASRSRGRSRSASPGSSRRSSSAPTKSAPAARGLLRLVALGEHEHAQRLAGAVREHDRAAHHLVGVLRVDAEADGEVDASRRTSPSLRLADELARLVDRVALARGRPSADAFLNFFPSLAPWSTARAIAPSRCLVDDFDAHRARGAGDACASRPRCWSVLRSCIFVLGDLARPASA